MADTAKTFETLARGGYWAKGIVYILLGGLSLTSVFAGGVGENAPEDALSELLGAPFGRFILAAIALGLFAFVLWRLAQSILNADNHDKDATGIITRIGQFCSAVGNGFLGVTAASLALNGSSGDGSGQEDVIAMLMSQPFGQWIVGIVGAIVVGAGLSQIYRGATRDYRDRIIIPQDKKPLLDAICQFGLVARGVVFIVIGGLIVYAAVTVSPEDAGGLRDALDWLRQQPYGLYIYAAAAAGLAAYGGYCAVQALYRRMNAPSAAEIKSAIPSVH